MTIAKNILAASAAVLALFAGSAQATTDEAIAERIKPYGTVCVAGDPCAEAVAACTVGIWWLVKSYRRIRNRYLVSLDS